MNSAFMKMRIKTLPRNGTVVTTPDGRGVVVEANVLKETVRVRLDGDDPVYKVYEKKDVKFVKGSKSETVEESEEIPPELEE